MAQKITREQLQEIVGEEVMVAIENKEIELLKRSDFDPRLNISKLETKTCRIELLTTTDNPEEIVIGCYCKRKWTNIKGFYEHVVKEECNYNK